MSETTRHDHAISSRNAACGRVAASFARVDDPAVTHAVWFTKPVTCFAPQVKAWPVDKPMLGHRGGGRLSD